MKNQAVFSMMIAATLMLTACGGKKEEEEQKEEPKNAADALQSLADKAKSMQNKEVVDPVDFRKLKDLLPAELAGLPRTESSGEKTGAMGFTVSTATARYSKEGNDSSVKVEIVDTGGIAGVATMALAAWTMADIDKETDDGYEKTTKVEGHKAFEKYNNKSKSGEVNVLVADRFVVNINVDNLTADQMKDLVGDLNLGKLEDMK